MGLVVDCHLQILNSLALSCSNVLNTADVEVGFISSFEALAMSLFS
ncbi:hypothetical protein KR52_09425 [Synechococcus sp. KORDI-52]|nr:hypothetical protein KR52_09425 [Synechococcus sp. KORDI-52]